MSADHTSAKTPPPGTTPCGRFAPSPSGPLHFGSLVAALASYLDARHHKGRWLVRIDDIDPPRSMAGATAEILHSLETHGFHADSIDYQSQRMPRYTAALEQLRDAGRVFWCNCSRRQLAATKAATKAAKKAATGRTPNSNSSNSVIAPYPGHCRTFLMPREDAAVRFRVSNETFEYADTFRGIQRRSLTRDPGDFIVWRRDGLVAYHLATAVDDGDAAISHVIRGSDLADSTFPQLAIMKALGLSPPVYGHIPVLLFTDGRKLSKHNFAPPLDNSQPIANLSRALHLLGQKPTSSKYSRPEDLLAEATSQWRADQVPAQLERVPAQTEL